MPELFARYRKFIWAAASAAAVAIGSVITDGSISNEEWIYVLVTALAAAGVIVTPNAPKQ